MDWSNLSNWANSIRSPFITSIPQQTGPYRPVKPNNYDDSIFLNEMQGNRPAGDSFEYGGARGAQGPNQVNNPSKNDETPIGEAELSESDNQVVEAAMQAAGVPESLLPVAMEHLSAMNESGNSNKNNTTNTANNTANTTTTNDDKIKKLAEFLQRYSEQFGDEGDISKSEYLRNVAEMAKGDAEEEGKPYIDPSSGVFDPKSPNFYDTKGSDYVDVARAAQEISNSKPSNEGNPFGATGSTGYNDKGFEDYLNDNEDKYKNLKEARVGYDNSKIRTRF